jgi:UDP-N-acetylglucosamine 1-carboxyvinyltransferase
MLQVLKHLGADVDMRGSVVTVEGKGITQNEVPNSLACRIRASNLVLGPMIARCGWGKVAYPGGCSIGSRPMDEHLRGLKQLGASLTEKHGFIEGSAKQLTGNEIYLDFPSVGATENLMMAAVLAQGNTLIHNAAREPEVVELQNFLCAMGAKIKGAGTSGIAVEGVRSLGGAEHRVIPDRIEAGTFLTIAAATRSDVVVSNVILEHVEAVVAKLREFGTKLNIYENNEIRVRQTKRLRGVDCKTMPYPGFPTDMQAPFMTLMSLADGVGVMSETVFENRFKHVDELARMGANIRVEGRAAVVKGVKSLSGACVMASDLRAGAALVAAGLAAEGITEIDGVHYIDRGYEALDHRLREIGGDIVRI